MLERIDNEGTVDILSYLNYMRTQRIYMVQTFDQYIFAHTAVLEYITFGKFVCLTITQGLMWIYEEVKEVKPNILYANILEDSENSYISVPTANAPKLISN